MTSTPEKPEKQSTHSTEPKSVESRLSDAVKRESDNRETCPNESSAIGDHTSPASGRALKNPSMAEPLNRLAFPSEPALATGAESKGGEFLNPSFANPILKKNIQLLSFNPQLQASLIATDPYPEHYVCKSKCGDVFIQLPKMIEAQSGELDEQEASKSEKLEPLHSRYDPRKEASRALPEISDPLATAVFIGAGMGYAPLEFANSAAQSNGLLWIEPDLRLFRTLIEHLDLSSILTRQRVWLAIGVAAEDLHSVLLPEISEFLSAPIKLIAHAASMKREQQLYLSYHKAMNEFVRHGGVMVRTSLFLTRISLTNQSLNFKNYSKSPGLMFLKNCLKPKESTKKGKVKGAIIVSAGPSLRKNIDLLKAAQENFTIIAVSTSLRSLLAKGIQPDFSAIIDYHTLSRRYFEGIEEEKAPALFCSSNANPQAIDSYPGQKLFENDLFLNTLFEGELGDKGSTKPASTVAHAAYNLAEHIGADPILFVGQDLAYTGRLLHLPGTAVQSQVYPQTNRFYSQENKEVELYFSQRPRFRQVDAIGGGKVPVDDLFFSYRVEFEQAFAQSQSTIINASEGGAVIKNAEHMTLKVALQKYSSSEKLDYGQLITNENAKLQWGELQGSLSKTIKKLLGEVDELLDIYESMLKLYDKVLRKNENKQSADEYVSKLRSLDLAAAKFKRIGYVVQQLAQADVWQRLRDDRLLNASELEGISKQAAQAKRDLSYTQGLSKATSFFRERLVVMQSGLQA